MSGGQDDAADFIDTSSGICGIEFIYFGKPATAGSKRGIPYQRKEGGLGVRLIHDNKRFHSFAAELKDIARHAACGRFFDNAVGLSLAIVRPRPKGHFRSGKNSGQLKDDAPDYPTSKPDSTKILRAVEDALTGVIWRDDSQIVRHCVSKDFGEQECLIIRVHEVKT